MVDHFGTEEGLGIGDYPHAPGVDHHTVQPPDEVMVLGAATHQYYMAQGASAAPTRGRGCPPAPPIRRPPPFHPVLSQPHGDIPIGIAGESSTPVSPNFRATLLTVYPKFVLPSPPPTSEMMTTTFVRSISWLDASAVTLQTSETPQLEERARAVAATATSSR